MRYFLCFTVVLAGLSLTACSPAEAPADGFQEASLSSSLPSSASVSSKNTSSAGTVNQASAPDSISDPVNQDSDTTMTATIAGGCFWCMEPPYQEHNGPGIIDVVVGYAGGSEETATYSQVGRGQTEHREAAQITYNPNQISYEEILDIFWRQIDPTDAGGQFADRGPQYTTAIYYHNQNQKEIAAASKRALADSGKFTESIATVIEPYSTFFPAEEYHQDFYKKSSEHYERYKKGSGRSAFLENNWAKTAALELSDAATGTPYALSDTERKRRRSQLDPESYKIIAEDSTEPPFDNEYWDNAERGIYVDKVSGEPLFASVHKYKSGTGWPSFWRPIDEEFIAEKEDKKLFVTRTEIRSTYGDSHLGHVFNDGPPDKTGLRYCMNSAALRFVPLTEMPEKGYGAYVDLFTEVSQ